MSPTSYRTAPPRVGNLHHTSVRQCVNEAWRLNHRGGILPHPCGIPSQPFTRSCGDPANPMPPIDPERRRRAVAVAQRRAPADLLLTNVRLVNTFTAEVYLAQIAVAAGLVAAILPPDEQSYRAAEVVDGRGRYAVPGLVDSHLHIESTMVLPPAFAAAVVPRGVLTVIADPHEIANVMGLPGIRLMVDASRGLPLDVFLQAPSCVPATALETAGAQIGPDEIRELLSWDEIVAVGEVMDFNAVLTQKGRAAAVLAE